MGSQSKKRITNTALTKKIYKNPIMWIRVSSNIKAAQYWSVSLTIRSILITILSAVFMNDPVKQAFISANLSYHGPAFHDQAKTFCQVSIAVGILGILISGILIFGAFKHSRVAIFIWMIAASVETLALIGIMIMWAIGGEHLLMILSLFGSLKTVYAIFVAKRAREQITTEKVENSGNQLS